MRQNQHHGKRGSALMTGLFFALLTALIAASLLKVTATSLTVSTDNERRVRTIYVAVAASEKAKEDLGFFYRNFNGMREQDAWTLTPPGFTGYTFDEDDDAVDNSGPYECPDPGYTIQPVGNLDTREIEAGNYRGLMAVGQAFLINCVATDTFGIRARVTEEISMNSIPVAQFAVFYENDLEILPGPDFIIEGRVHTNGDLYLGTHNTLSIDSFVTSVGNIYHQRKNAPDEVMGGTVRIKNGDGDYQSMGDLDSNNPDWALDSQTRWNGRVRSSDHGVPRLSLPLDLGENPHQVIERADPNDSAALAEIKFENKADLRIINGLGYDRNGNPVDLTYPDPLNPLVTKSIISTGSFVNHREGKTIVTTDVNIANLIESGITLGDGVVYVSDNQPGGNQQTAVRLTNGARLPSDGLTVATNNPLYIQGDYNTQNTAPSLVAGDAVNILSKSWVDTRNNYNDRTVSQASTVKTVIMTGNTETQVGNYNGGLENLFRFLEKWDGRTLSFRGSIICLWESQIATGRWIYGSPQYTAPTRDWRFDPMYIDPRNSPPGVPVVYAVERIHFTHAY